MSFRELAQFVNSSKTDFFSILSKNFCQWLILEVVRWNSLLFSLICGLYMSENRNRIKTTKKIERNQGKSQLLPNILTVWVTLHFDETENDEKGNLHTAGIFFHFVKGLFPMILSSNCPFKCCLKSANMTPLYGRKKKWKDQNDVSGKSEKKTVFAEKNEKNTLVAKNDRCPCGLSQKSILSHEQWKVRYRSGEPKRGTFREFERLFEEDEDDIVLFLDDSGVFRRRRPSASLSSSLSMLKLNRLIAKEFNVTNTNQPDFKTEQKKKISKENSLLSDLFSLTHLNESLIEQSIKHQSACP